MWSTLLPEGRGFFTTEEVGVVAVLQKATTYFHIPI